MKENIGFKKHIYWFPHSEFVKFENDIKSTAFELKSARKTSCGTLNAKDKTVRYASPEIFSGVCKRQGSWYRESNKAGSYLIHDTRTPDVYRHR